jgi:hypothetical protein
METSSNEDHSTTEPSRHEQRAAPRGSTPELALDTALKRHGHDGDDRDLFPP